MKESLVKKVNFVKGLSVALVPYQTNIAEVRYEVFESTAHEGYYCEYLVVEYTGGALSVRNCRGNSYSAIFDELAKLLDHCYYAELEFYQEICNGSDFKKVS